MRKLLTSMAALALIAGSFTAAAVSSEKLDRTSRETLERLYDTQPSTEPLIERAAGVLVFPSVYKGGAVVGAEYGEGALIENGRVTGYYSVAGGSIGLQLGGQKRSQVIAFMDRKALGDFKRSDNWKAGVDGSVVVANLGRSGELDTQTANEPILGFILGEKGLMYNATLEGSKITRINQ